MPLIWQLPDDDETESEIVTAEEEPKSGNDGVAKEPTTTTTSKPCQDKGGRVGLANFMRGPTTIADMRRVYFINMRNRPELSLNARSCKLRP